MMFIICVKDDKSLWMESGAAAFGSLLHPKEILLIPNDAL
jgi:hypothetical protein